MGCKILWSLVHARFGLSLKLMSNNEKKKKTIKPNVNISTWFGHTLMRAKSVKNINK